MGKKLGYYLFAALFSVFRIAPLRRDKFFLVATHDDSGEGNIGLAVEAIRKRRPEAKFIYLTKKDGIRRPFSFFFAKAYHMATAGVILLDNVFMPMAYTPISRKAKVVQLWHGTGTIKKFGLDSDPDEIARLARKGNRRLTHLIVNSRLTKKQYAGAFGVPEEKVYVLGLPRTDLILNDARMAEKAERFYEKYPELSGKKCTLYAPTFRDDEVDSPKMAIDLDKFVRRMGGEDVLLLRLHPFVSANFSVDVREKYGDKVVNVSDYPGVATLLAVSECLITDYSSIIFEYCLLGRPIIFYAYDIESFAKNGRDFYEPYEEFVPGPVVTEQGELERLWLDGFEYRDRLSGFCEANFEYVDQNAAERLLELIFDS